jgi:hypothetical protein
MEDQTQNLLVYGMMLQPTEPFRQGSQGFYIYFSFHMLIQNKFGKKQSEFYLWTGKNNL